MGPNPMEKKATHSNDMIMHHAIAHGSFSAVWSIIVSPVASPNMDIMSPPTLVRSSTRRPTLSRRKVATKQKTVFENPTPMLASSLSLSVSIPAFWNILGLYITTASIELSCWNKWIPTPVNRICRTFGVGRRNRSLHTPFPPPDSFWTSTTSSWQSSGIPAASLIPASLRRDSSMESEVFSRTFFASPSFPCITSQRGDSGMASTPGLTKQGDYIKTWRRRWFVLKQGKLLWFKDPSSASTPDAVPRGVVPVNECLTVKGAEDVLHKPFSFELSTSRYTMYFIANSEKEKEDWINSIGRSIVQHSRSLADSEVIDYDSRQAVV